MPVARWLVVAAATLLAGCSTRGSDIEAVTPPGLAQSSKEITVLGSDASTTKIVLPGKTSTQQ